jgi:hypothetical protein
MFVTNAKSHSLLDSDCFALETGTKPLYSTTDPRPTWLLQEEKSFMDTRLISVRVM